VQIPLEETLLETRARLRASLFTASGLQRTSSRPVLSARREAPRPRPGVEDVSIFLEPKRNPFFLRSIDRSRESKRTHGPVLFRLRPSTLAGAVVA